MMLMMKFIIDDIVDGKKIMMKIIIMIIKIVKVA